MSKTKEMTMLLLSVAVLSLAACGDRKEEQVLYSEELIVPEEASYETIEVEEGTFQKTASGNVSIYYPVTAELCWEKENSYYREVYVKNGQEVKKGDVLAVFDNAVSKADKEELSLSLTRMLEDAVAEKEERLTSIEEAKKEKEGLTGHDLRIAELEIEKLQAEYEQYVYQSEQDIAECEERIGEMKDEESHNMLLAPFDGVIDFVAYYNPGDLVDANKEIITMHATEKYYLVADDTDGNLWYNQEVVIRYGNRNDRKSVSGRVVSASDILPATIRQGKAVILLEEDIPAEELENGSNYQCVMEELQGILLIDKKTIHLEDGKSYVYVLENDMVQKRYIVPGLTNSSSTWVLDGLSEGQTVIVD